MTPIGEADLDEMAAFLYENLNRRNLPSAWKSSVMHPWSASPPNFGVQMRDEGRLVGVFCAIYSDQVIDGKLERFCNPHSWCVLPSHRSSGISLVLRLIKQPGYHFTMFTPNAKVAEIFRGLKFKDLDDELVYFPNVPWPWPRRGSFFTSEPRLIAERLSGQASTVYRDHQDIPWLRFAAFGTDGDTCLAIFKPIVIKRMDTAWIMYVSDDSALARHVRTFRHGMFHQHRMMLSQIEARFLSSRPTPSFRGRRTQPKLYLSRTLDDRRILDVYSELMSLDV